MKDLRESLDDLFTHQAEGASSWFRSREELDRRVREGELRPTPTPICEDEDEDEDEDFNVEERVAARAVLQYGLN
jgi:hypothetical protein